MDAFFSFLKVITIGVFALIALVLVLLAMPQTRFKRTLTEFLAWLGFVGGAWPGRQSPDLIPDVIPVIGWADDAAMSRWRWPAPISGGSSVSTGDDRPGNRHGVNAALLQGATELLADEGRRTARQAFVDAGESPLRSNGAMSPGARASGRCASVRGTPRCARRRPCHCMSKATSASTMRRSAPASR